jgi:hypothetical protein
MIAAQEELDWRCYRLYGLLPAGSDEADFEHPTPPEVALGERAFEIVLARRVAAGQESTTWFERHASTPITEIPDHWPEDYRGVVQRRIALIESDRNIGLIERPEYKRRWNSPSWESLEQAALRDWLLARLESPRYWAASAEQLPQITSTSRLADALQHDAEFMHIAGLYAGHADFRTAQLVAELVASEAVPFLPVLRYTETGLRKRAQWEETWALQRREDAGEDLASSIGKIPVPPKYQSKDFLKSDFWRLRGGLDVPKERWISYPRLRTRRRRQPGHRLGRLGSPAAGDRAGDLLHRHEGTRRLATRAPAAPARRPARTGALAQAVAQRHASRFRRAHGRLLRELRQRGGARAAIHAR